MPAVDDRAARGCRGRADQPDAQGACRPGPAAAALAGRLAPGGEACVCDLSNAFELSQPTISHHLKVLVEAGLLAREKRGVWVFHRVDAAALAALGALLGAGAIR